MKKQFSVPLVFLAGVKANDDPGLGTVLGGDDQDRLRPVPMSFAEWSQSRWCADYDHSGDITIEDFNRWWAMAGFGEAAWAHLNPGLTYSSDLK